MEGNDSEEPQEYMCPIKYTLFRDPVVCVSDGRTYERDGLIGFWRRQPLADLYGGPRLTSAAMAPATEMREEVKAWLAARPDYLPDGWPSRDPGPASSQSDLDRASAEIERLALLRDAASAAVDGGPGAAAAATRVAAASARSVCLVGQTPGGRRSYFLGWYDRLETYTGTVVIVAGRCAYVKRNTAVSPAQPMLWFAVNGFWHGGERRFLGQQTGWLIVEDGAAAPEHIVGTWKVWDEGRLWLARRLRCVAHEDGEGAEDAFANEAGGTDDEEGDDVETAGDVDGPAGEALLATAAAAVHLSGRTPMSAVHVRGYLGDYERVVGEDGQPLTVHGRFVYAKSGDLSKAMWWAGGFWHVGSSARVGEQEAILIAHDGSFTPEGVQAPWQFTAFVFDFGTRPALRWVDAPGLQCNGGLAPRIRRARRRPVLVLAIVGLSLGVWALALQN
jgi:hypothetical protein